MIQMIAHMEKKACWNVTQERKRRVDKELFVKRGVNREATMLSFIFASNGGESQYEVNESESGPRDENIMALMCVRYGFIDRMAIEATKKNYKRSVKAKYE